MSDLSHDLMLHALKGDKEDAINSLVTAAVTLMDALWGTSATAKYLRDLAAALERSQIKAVE